MTEQELLNEISRLRDELVASASLVQATEQALARYVKDTEHIQLDLERMTLLEAEVEEARAWETVPDGLYCDGVLAIQSFGNGRDIGIKIDDSFDMDDENDWQNNYEWLADGIGKGLPNDWRLQRRAPAAGEGGDGKANATTN